MALPSVSNLPVNIQSGVREFKELTFHSIPGSKFQVPKPEEDNDVTMKSLRLVADPRFQAIKHYKDTRQDDHHFQRLMNKTGNTSARGPNEEPGQMSFPEIAAKECAANAAKAGDNKKKNVMQERIEWQEAFDSSVTKLLIDFDLTHEPHCRLSHLDRMHSWFTEHGGKQQRKARKAPSYCTADRTAARMPAGSTRDLGGKLSGTSELLASSYVMRGRGGQTRQFLHSDGSQTAR